MTITGYTKLASSIITSSVWEEDHPTRIVWITMLAMVDRNGKVTSSVPGLARMARVTIEECKIALLKFQSPDPFDSSKIDQGKRIIEIPGGWTITNAGKYRSLMDHQERLHYQREWDKQKRANRPTSRYRKRITPDITPDNPRQNPTDPTQSESESESESIGGTPPTPYEIGEKEAVAQAEMAGVTDSEFTLYVFADWRSREGRDGANVKVSWIHYVKKRWVREGEDWRGGIHKGKGAPKPKSLFDRQIEQLAND